MGWLVERFVFEGLRVVFPVIGGIYICGAFCRLRFLSRSGSLGVIIHPFLFDEMDDPLLSALQDTHKCRDKRERLRLEAIYFNIIKEKTSHISQWQFLIGRSHHSSLLLGALVFGSDSFGCSEKAGAIMQAMGSLKDNLLLGGYFADLF